MIPATRNDGLRLQLSGADVTSLSALGTLPGVVVLAAAAANGPGLGTLIASAAGLAWQPPSPPALPMPGASQACPGDGTYLLEGADPAQWIRVQVYSAYLPASGSAQVALADLYGGVGIDDVSAANASAGLTETTQFSLTNVTPSLITGVTLWIDPVGSGAGTLSVSSDGTNFFQPHYQGDPNVLTWSSIASLASVSVWVRRTIGAAAVSNPRLLNLLRWAWNGV